MDSVVKKIKRCTQRPYTILHQNANYQLSIINYQLNKNGKEVNLGKDSPHRYHCAYRHCHHLRGDLVHGSVSKRNGCAITLAHPFFYWSKIYRSCKLFSAMMRCRVVPSSMFPMKRVSTRILSPWPASTRALMELPTQ